MNVRRPSKCPFKWVKFPEPMGILSNRFKVLAGSGVFYMALGQVYLCEGFSDGFRSQNLDLVVGFKHFLFIDELHHFSRWLLHHQPVTTSYFQFLLSPPRTQFWNLLSSHSMSAFSLVHGQCLAVQLTILPEQSCLGCWYALDMCLVGGLEHGFYSPIIYGIILLPLTNSYFSEG